MDENIIPNTSPENVLTALLIFCLGLTPWLLSWWLMRSWEPQARERIAAARLAVANRPLGTQLQTADRIYIEGLGYPIGDITCEYNARSNYIRCAVNPEGPCKDCRYYKARTIDVSGEKI
jgi:Family of unknown function (DUF6464)